MLQTHGFRGLWADAQEEGPPKLVENGEGAWKGTHVSPAMSPQR